MKHSFVRLTIIIQALLMIISCQKYSDFNYAPEEDIKLNNQAKIFVNNQFKKLNNPYSVENMLKAYAVLKNEPYQTAKTSSVIKTTHYYVKFFPKDSVEHESLLADSTLNFYPYPLDVEFPEEYDLSGYRDPDNEPSEYPHYYVSIPVGKKFPDVRYEILENLFIPDEKKIGEINKPLSTLEINLKGFNVDDLVNKSMELTGNDKEIAESSNMVLARYIPSGRIRVYDTRLGLLIGLEGIRIEARRWFTTHEGYTNSDGYYSLNGSFDRPANYSMWYATGQFSVRPHLVSTTMMYNGPKQSGNWNLDLTGGMYMFGAHIFRGAYRYYYKNIGGLSRPVIPGPNRQIYIAVDGTKNWAGENWIAFPAIRIARNWPDGTEYGSDVVFSVTCHETAHTAHVNTMNAWQIQYSQVANIIQESWCIGVQWFLTGMEYKERGISNYGDPNYFADNNLRRPHIYAYQYWSKAIDDNEYTPLFIDLMDDYNQLGQSFPPYADGVVNDQVLNYSLAYIEQNFLKYVYGLSSLTEKLKQYKPTGSSVTDAQIDSLMSFY